MIHQEEAYRSSGEEQRRSRYAAVTALVMILFALATGAFLHAQTGNARIRGLVTDPNGRIIANARVVLTNEETGVESATAPDGEGQYVFPEVPLGRYDLRVDAVGFKTFQQLGVILTADQNLTLNASLVVGSVAETISVSADGTQLDTQTGTIKNIIDTKSIEDLPLNGRDVRELLALTQGVIETGGNANSNGQSTTLPGEPFYSVNGGRVNTVNFLLDGVDNNDPYTNVSNPYPDPDALAQFSVQTSNFDAEYGRNSGAIVNSITKSGTNALHGSAYEFIRDSTLGMDANNWWSNHDKVAEDFLIQNQFGGSLGGPVVIPHLYNGRDRSFWFASYSQTINHSASGAAYEEVPTSTERGGDLSSISGIPALVNPTTGLTMSNNAIPVNKASAQFMTDFLPLPNSSTDPNRFNFAVPSRSSYGQLTVRGDQTLSNKERLAMRFYRYGYSSGSNPPAPGNIGVARAGFAGAVDNAVISLTSSLSPRLVNLFTYGYDHEETYAGEPPAGYPTSQTLGLNVYSVAPNPLYFSIAGWTGATAVYQGLPNDRNSFPVYDTLNLQFGKHELKFGGQIARTQQYWDWNQAFPNFAFTGNLSGYGLSDFLLGDFYQLYEGNTQVLNTRFTSWALFAQDNYRITPRLSLDLGVRWDPWIPPHFVGRYNDITQFSPSAFAAGQHSQVFPNAPAGMLYAGDPGVPAGGTNASWGNFSPRLGFSYDLLGNQKTVVRGAYGFFYDQPKDILYNRFTNGQPFNFNETLTNQASNSGGIATWDNPYNGGPDPVKVFANQSNNPGKNAVFQTPVTGYLTFEKFHMPYIQQWNLTVEQQLPWSSVARLTYVGSKGTHLLWTRDANAPIPGSGNPSTWAPDDARRPYAPGIGWMNGLYWDGYSNYESVQASFEHRFNRGLSALVNFNHSKSMDSNSDSQEYIATAPEDPFNLKLDYGPSDFDTPNNFEGSVVWVLPIPGTGNRVLDGVVRGWQSNVIASLHSGSPFSVYVPCDCALTSEPWQRAKLVGNPNLPTNRPESQRIAAWYNTAAYALSDPSFTDISGRNSLRAPGYKDVDMSLFKNFNIEKMQWQLRLEAFNVLNFPNLNLGWGSQYVYSPTFGQLTGSGGARVMNLALHVSF